MNISQAAKQSGLSRKPSVAMQVLGSWKYLGAAITDIAIISRRMLINCVFKPLPGSGFQPSGMQTVAAIVQQPGATKRSCKSPGS